MKQKTPECFSGWLSSGAALVDGDVIRFEVRPIGILGEGCYLLCTPTFIARARHSLVVVRRASGLK